MATRKSPRGSWAWRSCNRALSARRRDKGYITVVRKNVRKDQVALQNLNTPFVQREGQLHFQLSESLKKCSNVVLKEIHFSQGSGFIGFHWVSRAPTQTLALRLALGCFNKSRFATHQQTKMLLEPQPVQAPSSMIAVQIVAVEFYTNHICNCYESEMILLDMN